MQLCRLTEVTLECLSFDLLHCLHVNKLIMLHAYLASVLGPSRSILLLLRLRLMLLLIYLGLVTQIIDIGLCGIRRLIVAIYAVVCETGSL